MRVRDVNRRYARQVESVLPEASRPAFDEAVKRASYPLVYRETYGSRALAAAGEISGLNDEQKATVQSIREAYSRDLAAVNKEMEAASEKLESSVTVQDFMGGRFGGGGGPGGGRGRGGFGRGFGFMNDPEISKLIERRTDLQDTAIEKLKKVLTPEQFEALPSRSFRGQGGQDATTGGGDDNQQDRPRRRRDAAPDGDRPPAPRTPAPGPTR
jgi:hypothetical protein